MDTITNQLNDQPSADEDFGSRAAVFSEPPITLSDLPPITDVYVFDDQDTPDRLKAIITHMRKLAGRRELSMVLEFLPLPDGGKRFVVTFPEGDEIAVCRLFAKEVRREGFEDAAVCARLDAAQGQVRRAKETVDSIESTAARLGALTGDIIESLNKLHKAHQIGDFEGKRDLIDAIHEQLQHPSLRPLLDFVESCRLDRELRAVQQQMDALYEDRVRKAKEEGVDVHE